MFYNVDLARKAGLLNAAGDNLKPIKGRDDFVDALKAMKQASGQYGAISANTADPATTWRWFMTLYSGLAGPIVSDQGTRVTIDATALEETFAFMQSLTGPLGLMPGNAADATVTTLFSEGKSWLPVRRRVADPDLSRRQAARRQAVQLQRRAVPGHPRTQAGRLRRLPLAGHPEEPRALPATDGGRGRLHQGTAHRSYIWAGGGHIPAWLPVQTSKAFLDQKPQSNYIQAAFKAVYDPPGWYTGAGSDFQNAMGGVITEILGGADQPEQRRQRDDRQPEDVLDRHRPGALGRRNRRRDDDDRSHRDRSGSQARTIKLRRPAGSENQGRMAVRHAVPRPVRPVPDRAGHDRPGDQPVQHGHGEIRPR